MKNLGTILAAVFLGIVLLLYMCTFQVRFTEVAIRKTWGKPASSAITEPGLRFKWPRPIQSVVTYDKRIQRLDEQAAETRTKDGKNVLLATYTLWRIADPVIFHTNFPSGVEDGEKKLRTTVVTHKHAVTGRHEWGDFISTDPNERKIREIEREIKEAVAKDALTEYGIEVVDFGIKRLSLPQAVTSSVFQSMKSHEEAKSQRYTAEGRARADDILANANAKKGRIMAEVRRNVAEIQTEAERIVSTYYKEFDEHPQLRILLDKLRTIEEALTGRTTIFLDTNEAPWDLWNADTRANVAVQNGIPTQVSTAPKPD